MTTRLVALGMIALLAQVALLRELSTAFFGSELILILALGMWLLAVGVGALAGRGPGTGDTAGKTVPRLFLVLALVLPVALFTVRVLRHLLGALPGAYPSLGGMLLAVPVILLPVGLLVGRLFRDIAARYVQGGGTLARAYALDSGGSLLGGVLATVILLAGAPNLAVLLLAAAIAAGGGWLGPLAKTQRTTRPGRYLPAGTAALILLAVLPLSRHLDERLTTLVHPDLSACRDTPYGRLTLLRRTDQRVVLINDALVYEDQGTATEEFVQLAALQTVRPDSLLILGGAAQGTVRELLQHDPRSITAVALDRRGFELQRDLLTGQDTAGLDDPRVHMEFGDPRTILRKKGRFDLILIRMPQPDSGLGNRYYTREFFALCSEHLTDGGVLAFQLRSAENYWTPLLTWRNASIVRALDGIFAKVTVLPGVSNIVLASGAPLPGPGILARRFVQRKIRARLVGPAYIRYLYTNDRLEEIRRQLAAVHPPVNSDLHPVCYQYSLALWLSRFHPPLAAAGWIRWSPGPARGAAVWGLVLLGIVLAVKYLFGGIAPRWSALLTVFGAGWLGMALESVLILTYQTSSGVLYRDLGLLLTMFMAGLTAGSWFMGRRHAGAARYILAAVALLAGLVVILLVRDAIRGLAVTSLLLLGSGGTTGALFASVSDRDRNTGKGDRPDRVGPLYAADLWGGCLGGVACSLFLMPMLGLTATAGITGISALVLALLL